MSKVLVFKKSMVYSNNYNNVINFSNELERDNFINENLSESGNYLEELENRPNQSMLLTGVINNIIKVGLNFFEYKNSNYLVIQDNQNNLSFHFITDVANIDGNNNSITLTLQKDLIMNNLGFLDTLNNFKITKGHSPIENYLDKEFSNIYFKDVNYREIQRNNEGGISLFDNTPFLYVLTKATEGGGLTKEKDGRSYLEAFKVYVAPMKDIAISDAEKPVLFKGQYELRYNMEDGDYTPKEIPFNEMIISNNEYQFHYGISKRTQDTPNNYYIVEGSLFPSIGQNKIIFLGGETDEVTKKANDFNAGIFSDRNVLGTNGETAAYPVKITNIDNINYLFEIPTGNELYALSDTFWEWFSSSSPIPKNDNLIGVESDMDMKLLLKDLTNISGTSVWNGIALMNYINETTDDTIISAKVSNFNPLIINTQETNISFSDILNISKENQIYRLSYVNYTDALEKNKYKIYFQGLEEITKLRGLLPHKLLIENTLELDINNLFFKKETKIIDNVSVELDVLEFGHYASITPEWEERIKFIKEGVLDITTDANSWKNDKEFTIGANVWNSYKASNPVSSRFGLRTIGGAGKVFGGAITGSIFNSRSFTSNLPDIIDIQKENSKILSRNTREFNKKGADANIQSLLPLPSYKQQKVGGSGVTKGIFLGAGAEISTILERTNTRNMLETTSGSGDILGDLIFNYTNNFIMVNMEPVGVSYNSIVRDLRRFGLEYESEYYVNNINEIKRRNFNFIQSNNIFENINLNKYNFSFEELESFIDLFNRGLRIWWNAENFLNYEVLND